MAGNFMDMTHPEILFAEKHGCGHWQLEGAPVHFCAYCGGDIHDGDGFHELDGPVCEPCVESTWKVATAA